MAQLGVRTPPTTDHLGKEDCMMVVIMAILSKRMLFLDCDHRSAPQTPIFDLATNINFEKTQESRELAKYAKNEPTYRTFLEEIDN